MGDPAGTSLVWLCTAPDTPVGLLPVDVSGQVHRSGERPRVCLNSGAGNLPPIVRIAEQLGLDFEDTPSNSAIALIEIKHAYTYDDLQALGFPERCQRDF